MAAEYVGAKYRGGYEGYALFGVEAGMLAPDANTGGTVPALEICGFTMPPNVSGNNNPTPIYGPAGRDPYQMTGARKDLTWSTSMMVGGGAGGKKFLQSALSGGDAPSASFPNAGRQSCQPVVCLAYGAFDQCDSTSAYASVVRYAMANTLTVNIREAGAVTAEYSAVGLYGEDIALPGAITSTAVNLAGGPVFSMQHLELRITPPGGGTAIDYADILTDVSFTLTNNVQAKSIRTYNNVGGVTTNPLFRAARQIVPGQRPPTQVTFGLADRLPLALTPNEGLIGSIAGILSDGTTSIAFQTAQGYLQSASQNGGGGDGFMSYGASFLCSGLQII